MQGIYTYIPETNYVPREKSVAVILLLPFMVLISLVSVLNLLYFYINTFRNMCAIIIIIIIITLIFYNIQHEKTPSYSRTKHSSREFKTIMKQSVNDIKYKV